MNIETYNSGPMFQQTVEVTRRSLGALGAASATGGAFSLPYCRPSIRQGRRGQPLGLRNLAGNRAGVYGGRR
jgi:hypothetical protein